MSHKRISSADELEFNDEGIACRNEQPAKL